MAVHEHYPKRLSTRHLEMIKHRLVGMSNVDIAKSLGITPKTVSLIVNSPLFQGELARRRQQLEQREDSIIVGGVVKAREILDKASAKAAQSTVDDLDAEKPELRRSAAKDILDRTIGSKAEGRKGVGVVIDAQALDLVKETFKQVRMELVGA